MHAIHFLGVVLAVQNILWVLGILFLELWDNESRR